MLTRVKANLLAAGMDKLVGVATPHEHCWREENAHKALEVRLELFILALGLTQDVPTDRYPGEQASHDQPRGRNRRSEHDQG